MATEWKNIDGTFGQYQISNKGEIRSHIFVGGLMRENGLKSQKDNKGYLRVRITVRGKRLSLKLHREVAKAFLPNPCSLPQVNHKDGNKENNSVENLEWVSNVENAHHAIRNGLWDSVIEGSKKENERRKKAVVAVDISTGETKMFKSVADCEREIGTKHVSAVINGKRKQSKGYIFKHL